MPPLVLLAVIGVGCYAGYKVFAKLIEQAQPPGGEETERVRREAQAARETRDLGELEFDPVSGVYRPKKRA